MKLRVQDLRVQREAWKDNSVFSGWQDLRDFYSFLYPFYGIVFEFIKVMPTQTKDQGWGGVEGKKSLCKRRLGSGWEARGPRASAAAPVVSRHPRAA